MALASSNLAEAKAPRASDLEIVALNGMFDEQDTLGVIRYALEELLPGEPLAVVSSFGADSAVLLHHIAQVDPHKEVLFLETGKHFVETLEYVETIKQRFGLTNIRFLEPDAADLKRFDPHGTLWETDPDSCCHIRKTEPLKGALDQYAGWITGRRRHQTQERGVLPHFELTSDVRIKVNPLAYWTYEDVKAYKAEHDLPEHPLVQHGYRSIGCAPCTSATREGEDPRAGRWRGLNKAECGIHFDFNGQIASPAAKLENRTLFKSGRFIADPFHAWGEGDAPETSAYVHVPLAVWQENREAFIAADHPIGLLIAPGEDFEAVAEDFDRFASIAVAFPKFTDGRGYSYARLLRERYGFTGELRATGDILTDQVPFLRRCGFDALTVTNEATKKALESDALAEVSVYLQPVGSRGEAPVGTRPFLRRADQ